MTRRRRPLWRGLQHPCGYQLGLKHYSGSFDGQLRLENQGLSLEYIKGARSDIQKEPVKTEKKKSTQPQDPVTSQVADEFDEWLKKRIKKPTSES